MVGGSLIKPFSDPDRIGTRNGLAIEGLTHDSAACGITFEVEAGVT